MFKSKWLHPHLPEVYDVFMLLLANGVGALNIYQISAMFCNLILLFNLENTSKINKIDIIRIKSRFLIKIELLLILNNISIMLDFGVIILLLNILREI